MSGGLDDTICALATPPGEGGIGIIRLSGAGAISIAAQLARLRCGGSLTSVRSHRLYLADVECRTPRSEPPVDRTGLPSTYVLDEALVVVMRGPRSFTGEDVVEFHCHGGPFVLQSLCDAIVCRGGRLAEPGEFTKRAFLNGRLDLAQAEAVLDTIKAKTSHSLRVAEAQKRGALSREVDGIRQELLVALSHVEAGLDFAEEDISFVGRDDLQSILVRVNERLASLLATAREGRILREGAMVAIVGRPNVGKSSLMNALTRTERAIVTPIAGTTRDTLDAWMQIDGLPIRLVDTAGIRETHDPIEREGVRRSRHAVQDADLVVVVIDQSVQASEEDRAFLTGLDAAHSLVALNKSDLPRGIEKDAWLVEFLDGKEPVSMSAATGDGLDVLRQHIYGRLTSGSMEAADGLYITNLRHSECVRRAQEGIQQATAALESGLTGEFIAADLRCAADALGEITGAITTDDILNRIFSEFCIGK